jgi:hypothetical protein
VLVGQVVHLAENKAEQKETILFFLPLRLQVVDMVLAF